jgi:hypothetical protein
MVVQFPVVGSDSAGASVDVYFDTMELDPFKTDPRRVHRNFKRFIQGQLRPGERTQGKAGVIYDPPIINPGRMAPLRIVKAQPQLRAWRVERSKLWEPELHGSMTSKSKRRIRLP